MFSGRTPASLSPNRLTRALAELKAAGAPILDLTVSNPTREGIAYPREEILAALQDARSLTYEPTARGLLAAREAIAEWHAGQGSPADPASLILAGSTSEGYGWLFKLLCEPGDAVLVPRPSYPLFECLAELDSVRVVQYPLIEELAWGLDLSELDRLVRPETRAIILVNPNNPTGTYLKRDIWLRLQEFAAYRGLAIISDEVFFDYAWRADPRRTSALQGPHLALTFTLSGLSKISGLPQMKLGWIHVDGPSHLKAEALDRLEWIADSYLPVSAPIQHAAARWLELTPRIQDSIRLRTAENLESLQTAVGVGGSCRVRTPEGGWCAMLEVPRIHSDEEWALMLLENHSIWLQPGYFYDFQREGFLVASLLPEPEAFRAALQRLTGIFRPH